MVREGLGGVDSRNSMVGTGRPKAEDLWREQGQHAITALCYSRVEGIFPTPFGKDSERNFF